MTATSAAMLKIHEKVKEYFPYSTVRPSQGEFINTIYEALFCLEFKVGVLLKVLIIQASR